jgi:hypothetical protein
VVDRVLRDHPDLEVEPLSLPVPHAEGLVEFAGHAYDRRLRAAWRVYPHHLDSGGLFVVRLRRQGTSSADGPPPPPLLHPAAKLPEASAVRRVERAQTLLRDELGVDPRHLEGLRWMCATRHLWLHRCAVWPAAAWKPGRAWELTGCGLRAFARWGRGGERPTSWLVQWLGWRVQRRMDLEAEQWDRLLSGQVLPVSSEPGFTALTFEGEVLAVGLVREGRLRHLIPADRAEQLREALWLRQGR